MVSQFFAFLENELGEIEHGWSVDGTGEKLPFQIVKYKKGPFPGTVTYSTLGLSKVVQDSPVSHKKIRQELLFISGSDLGNQGIPAMLQYVGVRSLQKKTPYLRGDVLGPFGPLFQNATVEALYATIPVYFSDTFQVYKDDLLGPIVMTWLVPVTSREAEFVRKNGWEKFEDILEEVDPNLIDMSRASIL